MIRKHKVGKYVGWYTSDGILWDFKYNAQAHARYLALKGLVTAVETSGDHRLSRGQVEKLLTIVEEDDDVYAPT